MSDYVPHMSNWSPADVAHRIESARALSGKTKIELSEESGVAYSSLNRKLAQRPDSLTLQDTAKIAAALGVTIESLLVAA